MNQVPSPMCPHCGRNLSTDDLRGINCPSCGTSLPHHARAAQQVALVNQVMAQHMAAPPHAAYGQAMYGQAMAQSHLHAQQATRAAMSIGLIVAVIIGIVTVLIVVGAVVAVVLLRAP